MRYKSEDETKEVNLTEKGEVNWVKNKNWKASRGGNRGTNREKYQGNNNQEVEDVAQIESFAPAINQVTSHDIGHKAKEATITMNQKRSSREWFQMRCIERFE